MNTAPARRLLRTFQREVAAAALATAPPEQELIDERAIAELPPAVRDYLRFMAVVGRPRDWALRAGFSAQFRRAVGAWSACEVLQYDRRGPVSRIFMMKLALGGLPLTVRDNYLRGKGTLRARAFDLFSVAQGDGHELDVGELVTYLNDALLMAPSLLLGPEVTWQAAGERSFVVTLRDGGLSVSARVWLDPTGAPVDFSTTDRYFQTKEGKLQRTEWRTPISGWQDAHGRRLPTRARAVWQLPEGPFSYADFSFDPARIAFNVPPL